VINCVHPAGASLSEFLTCSRGDKPVLKPEMSIIASLYSAGEM
jgi:hypothetical protein